MEISVQIPSVVELVKQEKRSDPRARRSHPFLNGLTGLHLDDAGQSGTVSGGRYNHVGCHSEQSYQFQITGWGLGLYL
jgi:hypothetical protein